MWTAQEILSALAEHRAALREMGVQEIGLFGSYSRGTAIPESDIDFLVALEKPSFDCYMEVKFLLEDLFGHDVDLIRDKSLSPRLRQDVLAEVIYAA
jgi:predicted nucleotidyltransferase